MQPDNEIKYEITKNLLLLRQYYSLRAEVYDNRLGIKDLSKKPDKFDRKSFIVIAKQIDSVIGGGRLTIRNSVGDNLLPIENDCSVLKELFATSKLNLSSYGEISRLAVKHPFRKGIIAANIIRLLIDCGISNNCNYLFTAAPYPQVRLYEKILKGFGLNMTVHKELIYTKKKLYDPIKYEFYLCSMPLLKIS